MVRNLIPAIYLRNGVAIHGFSGLHADALPAAELARKYSESGADAILVFDLAKSDEGHEQNLTALREICAASEIPVYAAGHILRVEDVKKILYAGCRMAILSGAKPENVQILKDVSERFGKDRIGIFLRSVGEYKAAAEELTYAGRVCLIAFSGVELEKLLEKLPAREDGYLLYSEGNCATLAGFLYEEEDDSPESEEAPDKVAVKGLLRAESALGRLTTMLGGGNVDAEEANARLRLLADGRFAGLCGTLSGEEEGAFFATKAAALEQDICMNVLTSELSFDEFTTNADGLIPVVVQDYKNDEVLMLAYMNRESFEATLATGFMTYYSRSRQELWRKGETSGHLQYVKSLAIDCDNDTLLAKVAQVGAACHTGNRSCFYRELCRKDENIGNPLLVLERDYKVIADRKAHPKQGSYTNYLFDKGLDKILKKVGEENTEIIIAAKNPDADEIHYEIADYLYHLMVLMVEKGVTWTDITDELARRQ